MISLSLSLSLSLWREREGCGGGDSVCGFLNTSEIYKYNVLSGSALPMMDGFLADCPHSSHSHLSRKVCVISSFPCLNLKPQVLTDIFTV